MCDIVMYTKTITDVNGKYTLLSVTKGKNEVQFTFVGYESKTIENAKLCSYLA